MHIAGNCNIHYKISDKEIVSYCLNSMYPKYYFKFLISILISNSASIELIWFVNFGVGVANISDVGYRVGNTPMLALQSSVVRSSDRVSLQSTRNPMQFSSLLKANSAEMKLTGTLGRYLEGGKGENTQRKEGKYTSVNININAIMKNQCGYSYDKPSIHLQLNVLSPPSLMNIRDQLRIRNSLTSTIVQLLVLATSI